MRAKKTAKNIIWGLIYELVMVVCGLILPRLILMSFGSEYNGVTSAVRQFLQVIVLFQAGVGGVTMAALYKPLAESDIAQISSIVKTTEGFLRKVVLMFLVFIVIIACGYPFLVIEQFDWFFTFSLVLIMSLSTCAQYFFGRAYELLLSADQNQRIISIVNCFKIVINTAISAVMIYLGFGIRSVMLAAATVYVIAPLFVCAYTKRKYGINSNAVKDNSVIRQRWDNFGRQVAYFVSTNTAIVILSIFSNAFEVSVFAVYMLVISGVLGLFVPLTNGVSAAFGNMLAKGEHELVKKNLRIYEQVVFTAATFLFSVVIIMALPFFALYTSGVTDVSYHRPTFLYVLAAAYMFNCFRFPYEGIAVAAGHFRQIRNPSFIEAAINICISISLVSRMGIVGVAAGVLAAFVFRTVYFAIYVSRNIVLRTLWTFIKRLLLSCCCILLVFGVFTIIPLPETVTISLWILNAIIVSAVSFIFTALVETLFYRKDLKELIKMARGVLTKRTAVAVNNGI